MAAITRIYAEGGIAGFWVGNGLSVVKIFPESAIKFLTYEASVCLVPIAPSTRAEKYHVVGPQKRLFAHYVDNVEDVREISGTSRFLSGGIGGITSQLSEYFPVLVREPSVDVFGDRHIPNRDVENANDEQHRGVESDDRFSCKAALGVGWLKGILSWARGA
jgi:hypothetical protein